jgi:hypothetical protein
VLHQSSAAIIAFAQANSQYSPRTIVGGFLQAVRPPYIAIQSTPIAFPHLDCDTDRF